MKLLSNYLSNEHFKGFDSYKYSSIDTSPLAVYISHPFWNQVVKLVPSWVAPNVLTFGGFVLTMSGFLIFSYYDYYLYASSDKVGYPPIPREIWIVLAVFTFCAHVLDGIDGKQARKVGASGPTGELFDHGIDSWLTVPFTVCLFSIFGRGDYSISAFRMMLILQSVQLVFITTHWEKYNTGILFLSWGYDASQYTLAILYLVTFLKGGHGMWKFTVPLVEVTPAESAEWIFYFAAFGISIPMSFYNLYLAYKNKTGKMKPFYEAVLPMLSTLILFGAAIVWGLASPSDVLNEDPRAYMWLMGTIFSNIACRLIISQMTNTRCEAFNLLLFPYLLVVLVALAFPSFFGAWELTTLRVLSVAVTVAHVHYGASVVYQMCEHFKIYCFVLKKPQKVTEVLEPLIAHVEEENGGK